MAQTALTSFYSTRKRFKDTGKSVKAEGQIKLSDIILKDSEFPKTHEPSKKRAGKSKAKGKVVNKVTNYLKAPESNNLNVTKESQKEKNEAPRTPKRNLSSPDELTPSKKKLLMSPGASICNTPTDGKLQNGSCTPKKQDPAARKKLLLNSPNRYISPKKVLISNSPCVSPQKAATYENMSNKDLASLLNESRSKILFNGKLDELKKSLAKFSSVSAKTKEFQSNSCKITSVISSVKNSDSNQETTPIIQGEPAYKKYSYLAAPESESLILPYKYKLLSETFRCLDTVVSMLNNRKEKITFEKVQNGVQKMMNKNFLKSHLGQIMTVFPTAYSLHYENNDSYIINKANPYQLIIIPLLLDVNGNSSSISEVPPNGQKNSRNSFVHMTPTHLLHRKKEFLYNLTEIVKKHHQDFLTRLNFPSVSGKIVRWHPKFVVDSVPDIPVTALPEEPETKVSTAKDVLNKIRGSVRGRVVKALQSVADSHKVPESKEKKSSQVDSKTNSVIKKENSALKGICSDLLEKIRARESAKLVENMTRSIEDEKRSAMLERIPKIAQILWHYFIAERKAAVPIDAAVDKIIHSCNSLTTPDAVKEHLHLISEAMPGWLSFIKITKGEYITMDKKKDINVLLGNLK